ncbi:MAG: hypothetical protein KC503_12885 [Myxococcales bacterium]|nr:hypothetical protein [Myxococcales bacterium]
MSGMRTSSRAPWIALLCASALALAAGASGCRLPGGKRGKGRSAKTGARKKPQKNLQIGRSLDPAYGNDIIWVHHYRLRTRLDMTDAGGFARLSAKRRQHLDQLVEGSTVASDVYATAERILWVLPESAAGGAHEILLAEDLGRLFVINPRQHRIWSRPRSRLADTLDLTSGPSEHSPETAELIPLAGAPARHGLRVRRHRTRVSLSYRPPNERVRAWSLRLRFDSEGPDMRNAELLGDLRFYHPIYLVALPLLSSRRGLLTLEGIASQTAPPWRWRRRVANESLGGPALAELCTVEYLGAKRISAARFAAKRDGYIESRRLRLPAAQQLVSQRELRGLRRGAAAKLDVKNESPFAAVIYLDGVRVAWLGPGSELSIKGLSAGFYRVFAATPTGSRTWPMRDMYVPGPLTLE